MKYNKLAFLISLLFLLSCSSTRPVSDEQIFRTKEIEERNFSLVVAYAVPKKKKGVVLIPDYYTLTIYKDSVFANLPYYGRIKSGSLVDRQGQIKFAEPVVDYIIQSNRNNTKWKIKCRVNTKGENLDLYLKIKPNGVCKFSINSEKRDSIVYKGFIK